MMRIICAAAAVLLAAPIPACAARERAEEDAFLLQKASTVEELLGDIRQDPKIRARYAKHFGIPEAETAQRIGAGLRVQPLVSPVKASVYYIGKDGAVPRKSVLMSRGQLVFVGSDGQPLLRWGSGNPLSSDLPPTAVAANDPAAGGEAGAAGVAGDSSQPPLVIEETKPIIQVKVAPDSYPAVNPIPGTTALASAAVTPQGTPVALASEQPVVVAQAPGAPYAGTAVSRSGPNWGMIGGVAGLLGGLAALSGGGGSGVDMSASSPPPDVPEPSGLLLLGSLLSMAGGARLCRKR